MQPAICLRRAGRLLIQIVGHFNMAPALGQAAAGLLEQQVQIEAGNRIPRQAAGTMLQHGAALRVVDGQTHRQRLLTAGHGRRQ
ncbi:MAG: hypothetical protein RII27_03075, partial [Alphaproteobacteria bacterium]